MRLLTSNERHEEVLCPGERRGAKTLPKEREQGTEIPCGMRT